MYAVRCGFLYTVFKQKSIFPITSKMTTNLYDEILQSVNSCKIIDLLKVCKNKVAL